jgi:hypothetical protein
MAIFGNTSAYSSNQTTVSTQTATDSYNQSAVRTENLSDVGNVNVSLGDKSASLGSLFPFAVLAAGGLFVWFYLKRKH